jgi:2-phospho-L-lactate guanylyltransferase
MRPIILVPVKNQERAKVRMAHFLTPTEREHLAWAMFLDVSRTLSCVGLPVAVVTDSPRAAERAADLGWRVFRESEQVSESSSVDAVSRQLSAEGVTAVLRIPADVPLIQSSDIDEIIDFHLSMPLAVLVPSRDGTGTNAILRSPPDLFPSRFGKNSLLLHRHDALRAGAQLRIVENRRLALDLDEFEDLKCFMHMPSTTETHRFLSATALAERIAHAAAGANFD